VLISSEVDVILWIVIGGLLGALLIMFAAWFSWEWYTAPLLDEDMNVISDPHHRMPS
jgi:hypothetical protein